MTRAAWKGWGAAGGCWRRMMNRVMAGAALGWLAVASHSAVAAPVSVLDDDGQRVSLPAPARRIISVAPHATELLYAAGAGGQVVATVRYADYPAAARQLPQVGDAHALDLERIAALKPDLLVVWLHGSSERQMEQLRALRIPIFHSEPKRLEQIGDSLRRLGVLAGQEPAAHAAATQFDKTLAALRTQFAGRSPLRVFYQVWHQPLMTVNRAHLINEVISLCGGVNVFAAQNVLVPVLSVESVLAARPQVLVTASGDGRPDDALAPWQAFKTFEPIARGQVIWLPADLISRATPRVLEGADRLCRELDAIRAHPTGR